MERHKKWLNGEDGERANLSGANLSGADLHRANLSGTDMSHTNMSHSNLSGADMSNTNLSHSDLSYADLSGADMSYADLSHAILIGTDLSYSDLGCAILIGTDMSHSDLSGANLSHANLSSAKGLMHQHEWMEENLIKCGDGFIVYKTFGEIHKPNVEWRIEEGCIITENVNFDRASDCACGINVGTLTWVLNSTRVNEIWECLIPFDALSGVCIPYNTDGRFRCEMVKLIKKYSREELSNKRL